MLILIAESKTMTPCRDVVSQDSYSMHCPVLEAHADEIMDSLREMSIDDLAAKIKVSVPMARKFREMIYEFPDKSSGSEAISAFTGVVFKAFSYATLPVSACKEAHRRIRIISSLYGWLRPDDIVKQYRLDFTTPLAPGGLPFTAYWRDAITGCVVDYLHANDCQNILNLLPSDAAKCIDWKKIAPIAKVWKADFKEIQEGGKEHTPHAGRLKVLRGRLLRQIITENITDPRDLLTLESESYMASLADSSGNIIFHTVAD